MVAANLIVVAYHKFDRSGDEKDETAGRGRNYKAGPNSNDSTAPSYL